LESGINRVNKLKDLVGKGLYTILETDLV